MPFSCHAHVFGYRPYLVYKYDERDLAWNAGVGAFPTVLSVPPPRSWKQETMGGGRASQPAWMSLGWSHDGQLSPWHQPAFLSFCLVAGGL